MELLEIPIMLPLAQKTNSTHERHRNYQSTFALIQWVRINMQPVASGSVQSKKDLKELELAAKLDFIVNGDD